MDTLWNDIFHAQPDALLMIAGLAFLAVAVIGSVKSYFDPGKIGRIASGGVGAILLVTGLAMYSRTPGAAPTASAAQAVAQSTGAPGQTTTACYVPGKWPSEVGKPMTVGDSCSDASGKPGKAVLVNPVCTFTSGPLSGTSQRFNHLMYVGYSCVSPDHKNQGSVLAPSASHS
jgi:hypothetical protein